MWSDQAIEYTREQLTNATFGSREGKVYFKHQTDNYGYIKVADIYKNWTIHFLMKDCSVTFNSMDEMIEAGWVLDQEDGYLESKK